MPPGLLEYDAAHCLQLTQAILTAIVSTSTSGDATYLRGREIRDALAAALAEIVALEPEAKTLRLIEDAAHLARGLVAHHRRNPKLDQVKARMTRIDLSSGGHA
jgi:hypothetical protein